MAGPDRGWSVLGWRAACANTEGDRRELSYARHLRTVFRLGCNLVVLDAEENEWTALQPLPADTRRIDVWWRDDASSRLMLLLAYLITRTEDWEGARIRVLGMCSTGDGTESAEAPHSTLAEVRIQAEAVMVEQTGSEAIMQNPADASLVFVPFRLHNNHLLGPFDSELGELLAPLPMTVLVLAAEDMDLNAEPEEGQAAETARTMDTMVDAEHLAELTARDAERAETECKEKRDALAAATEQSSGANNISQLLAELAELEVLAEKARRRSARHAAKAEAARQDAQALGALPQE